MQKTISIESCSNPELWRAAAREGCLGRAHGRGRQKEWLGRQAADKCQLARGWADNKQAKLNASWTKLSDRIGNYFQFAKENPLKCIVNVAQLGWNIVTLPLTALDGALNRVFKLAVVAGVTGAFYVGYHHGPWLFGELVNFFTTPGNATDIQDFNMRLHMGNATVLPYVEQPDLFLPGLAGRRQGLTLRRRRRHPRRLALL